MIIKTVRISKNGRDKLIRLKSKTGIQNWNILCRWALCYSLREGTVPADVKIKEENVLEMSWVVFAGEYGEIYEGIIKEWCLEHGILVTDENVEKYFKLHLERGIGYLSGTNFIKNLEDLLRRTGDKNGDIS